jgi:anti-sigma-K factor RskA
MIDESLQEEAALYASGALSAREREQFESTLEFHRGLPELVAELEEVSAALLVATLPARPPVPSAELEARLLRRLRARAQQGDRDSRRESVAANSASGISE